MVNELDSQISDYAKIRRLVESRDYDDLEKAIEIATLPESTEQQLQKALASRDKYIIERVFGELDMRVMQALCWACWK